MKKLEIKIGSKAPRIDLGAKALKIDLLGKLKKKKPLRLKRKTNRGKVA
jgi:hypothetical protein